MVIGLLAITAIPTVTGVGQAVSSQKRQNAAAKEQEKFNLTAVLLPSAEEEAEGKRRREAGFCVVGDGRLLLDVGEQQPAPAGHRFCGYHFAYPCAEGHLGLVTTVSDAPPMLHWVFVDGATGAVRHGGRSQTLGHVIGPWGWSADEALLTLDGRAGGFVARRDDDGLWAAHWDPDGRMLAAGEGACRPLLLRRRPLLGLESRYVRDNA
ncbi:hypothetical protein CDD83_8903 [Cordyceps sp. RAO-2017]|nr:hypothetical protein CDD83_8903 [Cordyceps sp. RAO-2017]